MSIKERRDAIDAIDRELLRLLNMRARLAVQVGEKKRAAGLSLCDPAREREVIERACRANEGPLDESAVVSLFRCIIRASRLAEARVMDEPEAQQKKAGRSNEQSSRNERPRGGTLQRRRVNTAQGRRSGAA